MRKTIGIALVFAIITAVCAAGVAQSVLSVCDYTPPESRLESLTLQGMFQWYDGPFADDRMGSVLMTAGAEYGNLFSSPGSGHRLDTVAELRGTLEAWTFAIRGDGDLKAFFDGDLFALGAFGIEGSNDGLEVDLTAGLGSGRFRDATPLAKAIRIQNALLDLGLLLAPLESDPLLAIAQTLGSVGPTDEEQAIAVSDQLIATGLLRDDELDILGLLAVEEIITSADGGRLCGGDVQARIGVAAMVLPEMSIATTAALLYNAAFVPDPVSQLILNASLKLRLAYLGQMSGALDASYSRHLPSGWTARADYRCTIDRGWSRPDRTLIDHDLTASLTTQLFGSVGLSLAGELRYGNNDEELTTSLTVHLAYDLF